MEIEQEVALILVYDVLQFVVVFVIRSTDPYCIAMLT